MTRKEVISGSPRAWYMARAETTVKKTKETVTREDQYMSVARVECACLSLGPQLYSSVTQVFLAHQASSKKSISLLRLDAKKVKETSNKYIFYVSAYIIILAHQGPDQVNDAVKVRFPLQSSFGVKGRSNLWVRRSKNLTYSKIFNNHY